MQASVQASACTAVMHVKEARVLKRVRATKPQIERRGITDGVTRRCDEFIEAGPRKFEPTRWMIAKISELLQHDVKEVVRMHPDEWKGAKCSA
jgi:hypothetical protein